MADRYRVLITGSRTWEDAEAIASELAGLALLHREGVTVVHGACPKGADAMADAAARRLGLAVEPHAADWEAPCRTECKPDHRRRRRNGSTYCPAAGNHRNQEMVDTRPDACLSFFQPGAANRGTSDCVRRAVAAGIPVEPHGQVPQAVARLLADDQTGVRFLWDN